MHKTKQRQGDERAAPSQVTRGYEVKKKHNFKSQRVRGSAEWEYGGNKNKDEKEADGLQKDEDGWAKIILHTWALNTV